MTSKTVDWSTIEVDTDGHIQEGIVYAISGCWTDGTEMTDDELDDLYDSDYSRLYDIAYGNAISAAEDAFSYDR